MAGVTCSADETTSAVATEIWIDLLMSEVCERVAEFVVCGEEPNHERSDALALAETSFKQRDAVLAIGECQHWKWWHSWYSHLSKWAELFAGRVRKLDLDRVPHTVDEETIEGLLRSMTLKDVYIRERSEHLCMLQNSKSLQKLSVVLSEVDHNVLMNTLATLNLDTLELHCIVYRERTSTDRGCVQSIFDVFGDFSISSRCSKLTTLNLNCRHCSDSALVSTIEGLSSLRVFETGADSVDNALVSALHSVETVRLTSWHAEALATLVGKSVVYVPWILDIGEVRQFPRLEHIGVCMFDPQSELLPAVVCHLRCLRALTLNFGNIPAEPETELTVAKTSNRVLNVVSKIPGLEELSLDGNLVENISDEEIEAVCKVLGQRLKAFRFTLQVVRMDCGSPHERLALLLEILAKYNPCLRQFSMFIHFDPELRQSESHEEVQRRLAEIHRARIMFERRLPGALDFGFDDLVKGIFGHPTENVERHLHSSDQNWQNQQSS